MIPEPSLIHLDFIRVLLAVVLFGIAAYHDVNGREIPDYIWNVLVVSGGLLFILHVNIINDPFGLTLHYIGNIALAIGIGWAIYLMGFFGGADTKAITSIAVLFPTLPYLGTTPLLGSVYSIPVYEPMIAAPYNIILPLVIITFLANTAIFGLFYPLALAIRSSIRGIDRDQPINSILSDEVSTKELTHYHGKVVDSSVYDKAGGGYIRQYIQNSRNGLPTDFFRHYMDWYRTKYDSEATLYDVEWSVQEFISDYNENHENKYKINFDDNPLADSIEDIEHTLSQIQQKETVLITPGFPFIVPMLFGVISMVTIGDLVFAILTFLN